MYLRMVHHVCVFTRLLCPTPHLLGQRIVCGSDRLCVYCVPANGLC